MKQFPRIFEDLLPDKKVWHSAKIESAIGTTDALAERMRARLDKNYRDAFYDSICWLWLEKQLIINGRRRIRRFSEGHTQDVLYARFVAITVGRDQALYTRSRWFQITASCVAEMFPDFFLHDPEAEPEYYQWPYKHVGLDFLAFVYQVHNRFEMLDYAEEKKMNLFYFRDWATNYVLCYNLQQGSEIYKIGVSREGIPHIQREDWNARSQANNLSSLLKHESEKTSTDHNDDQRGEAKLSTDDTTSSAVKSTPSNKRSKTT